MCIRQSKPAGYLSTRIKTLLGHNAIYDAEYYRMIEALAVRSADVMAESIVQEFRPQTVVDVGCGTGALLEALKKRGCAQVFGLEYSDAALMYCRERGLEVQQFDLERDQFCHDRTFDVAISMEVAEHLPARMADTYIDLIQQLSDRIVFTAATPGQGGEDHVNEQPHAYWIAKLQARGFAYEAERSARWQREWETRQIAACYAKNVMLFRRTTEED
jgi:2-polyprenyl-3-methyl-5-hydroxy-6-metoxy-1,4-benzoquinol methylase